METESNFALLTIKSKLAWILFLFLACFIIILFFWWQTGRLNEEASSLVTVNHDVDLDIYDKIKNNPKTKLAYDSLVYGNSIDSYDRFTVLENDDEIKKDKALLSMVTLFKISALLNYDREAAFKEYYDFYRDETNDLVDRAYALLMAQQSTVASSDGQKILFFLNENEVRDIKTLDNTNIQYAISKKIFSLWPFPITAARLASFEVNNLGKPDISLKKKAQKIYDKYMYNFDSNLKYMENKQGLRHLVSNSIAAKASLFSRLEAFGVTKSNETSALYEESIQKAILYSPSGTKHFLMAAFLEHEVKVDDKIKVDKILKAFVEEKQVRGIDSRVVRNLTDEKLRTELYPNLNILYKKDEEFRKKVLEVAK